MGATDFTDFVEQKPRTRGQLDAATAYKLATDAALHQYGHDPYNGTISTTNGYAVVTSAPVTMRQAHRMITQYQAWEDNVAEWQDFRDGYAPKPRKRVENPFYGCEISKWGACVAIQIKRSHDDNRRGWLFYGLAAM